MAFPVALLLKVVTVWLLLLAAGLCARYHLNRLTINEESQLRRIRLKSRLTGYELFSKLNHEYGGIFQISYTASGYGKALPTIGCSRLSFALDVFQWSDHGTVIIPCACRHDDSLMAAALISHETGHLIQHTRHPDSLPSIIFRRFVVVVSPVASALGAAGLILLPFSGLPECAWLFIGIGLLVPLAWAGITAKEWRATKAGLDAVIATGSMIADEVATCKRIWILWALTYVYKLYVYSIPIAAVLISNINC